MANISIWFGSFQQLEVHISDGKGCNTVESSPESQMLPGCLGFPLAALVMSMSSQIPAAIWLNFRLKGMMPPGWMVRMPLVLSTGRHRPRPELQAFGQFCYRVGAFAISHHSFQLPDPLGNGWWKSLISYRNEVWYRSLQIFKASFP